MLSGWRAAKFSFDHLWREFFAVNLFQQAPRLEMPVYFMEGRHDHVVTGEVAEEYFRALGAPAGKQIFWFEHSAHWSQLDEPKKPGSSTPATTRPREYVRPGLPISR
jgi:pimeloyl-ACP methyl ester carboxylesterase